MPVCGNYLFFELPKKIVLNPKDGACHAWQAGVQRNRRFRFARLSQIFSKKKT